MIVSQVRLMWNSENISGCTKDNICNLRLSLLTFTRRMLILVETDPFSSKIHRVLIFGNESRIPVLISEVTFLTTHHRLVFYYSIIYIPFWNCCACNLSKSCVWSSSSLLSHTPFSVCMDSNVYVVTFLQESITWNSLTLIRFLRLSLRDNND